MKTNKTKPSMGRYYWFFTVLFVTANAQYAFQRFKKGEGGWELINIPLIVILAAVAVIVLALIKRSLKKISLLAEPTHLRPGAANDPWTYFGSYSKEEIDGAVKLLQQQSVTHEVVFDSHFQPVNGGWSGPYGLWVRDEHADSAQKLLIPFFDKT